MKVSILVNCYNGEKYLREALGSIYAQTHGDWEIIFWDNASTDNSAAIAKSFDQKLRYFHSDVNTSLGEARRLAVTKATGDWIAFLDTDDYWLKNKLEVQLAAVEISSVALCYGGIREIDESSNLIREAIPVARSGDQFDRLLNQFDVNMVTPLVRRSALIKHGISFDGEIFASEEYNLFMRLAAKENVLSISQVLGVYRVYPGSLTAEKMSHWASERLYTLNQIKKENPGIEIKYASAFIEASARGLYYDARYLMQIGDVNGARESLRTAGSSVFKYRLLHFLSLLPFFWHLAHKETVRRKISNIMSKF